MTQKQTREKQDASVNDPRSAESEVGLIMKRQGPLQLDESINQEYSLFTKHDRSPGHRSWYGYFLNNTSEKSEILFVDQIDSFSKFGSLVATRGLVLKHFNPTTDQHDKNTALGPNEVNAYFMTIGRTHMKGFTVYVDDSRRNLIERVHEFAVINFNANLKTHPDNAETITALSVQELLVEMNLGFSMFGI